VPKQFVAGRVEPHQAGRAPEVEGVHANHPGGQLRIVEQ
jgi:hypothetical protein